MILEAIANVFFGLVGFVVGLFPDGGAPGWLSDGAGMLADLAGYASGLGAWVPFNLAGTVLALVLSCMAVGFVIKVVRLVASYITGGGGSAA